MIGFRAQRERTFGAKSTEKRQSGEEASVKTGRRPADIDQVTEAVLLQTEGGFIRIHYRRSGFKI